jgi:MFS family permease
MPPSMWRRLLDRTYFALFREYPQLAALAVMTGSAQFAVALVSIYALPKYLDTHWHVSGKEIGLVSAVFLASETVLKIPMGRISDRLGRKPFIVLGPLLTCLNPTLIVSLPAALWRLILPIRALDGAGIAALWPPLFATVGDLTRGRSRAAAMSVINTVYVAAMGVAIALGGFAAYLFHSDRAPFYLASVLLLAASAAGHFGLRGRPRRPEEDEQVASDPTGPPPAPATVPTVAFALVLLLSFLMMSGVLVLPSFLVLYLQKDLNLTDLGMSGLLIGLGIPVLLLGLPLGHAADRAGPSVAVRLAISLAAVAMWAMPFCNTVPTFGVVAVIITLACMFGMPAWLALVSGLAPAKWRGGVMGAVATAEGVGAVIGPLIGGYLWDISHRAIFFGAAALVTLAAVVALATLRRLPEPGTD